GSFKEEPDEVDETASGLERIVAAFYDVVFCP
ncbi:hypothetical protein AVEN_124803-1, partial [Araneus ventricosus]